MAITNGLLPAHSKLVYGDTKMNKKRTSPRKPASSLTPYLTVRDADGAIAFYKEAFAAKEKERHNVEDSLLVQHAELTICRTKVYLCDEYVDAGILAPQSLGGSSTMLHLNVPDATKVWNAAINAGAVEVSPLVEVPWGGICGKLVDPYGHYWSIASEVTDTKKAIFENIADIELAVKEDITIAPESQTEH